ncbi:MAG: metallophosphoesterase [Bacilli bacterium]|nr:metallophosphoesterase [Bacilli bacterium]
MHNETFYTSKDIKDFKIALISDLHFYPQYNQKIFDKIINQIKENKPDYITIVGDILDSSDTEDLTRLKDFLTQLAEICTTLVSTGNHDEKKGSMKNWSSNKNNKFIEMLNSIHNLYYLNDTAFTIGNITFYGFNLSYNYYEIDEEKYETFCKEANQLKYSLNENNYNITLCHSPINIYKFIRENPNHSLNKSNLILSGHMHNGCLPFILSHPLNKIFKSSRGLVSPARTLFPKYAQGRIYERDGYVYEGITKLSHSTKLFHKFDFLFQKKVEFLTIKSQEKTSSN